MLYKDADVVRVAKVGKGRLAAIGWTRSKDVGRADTKKVLDKPQHRYAGSSVGRTRMQWVDMAADA